MFGAFLQPAAGLSMVTHGPGSSPDLMDHLSSPRRSERLDRLERLERTIQNDLVPRLMTSHQVGPVSPSMGAAAARADMTAAHPSEGLGEYGQFREAIRRD